MKTGIGGKAIGALLMLTAGAASAAGDKAAGEKVFTRCAACHQVGPAAKAGFGPVLNGVVGAKAASSAGYAYSPAIKAAGLVWSAATLERFLTAPARLVPGTKMVFPGLAEARDRMDVIAYLAQFDAKGRGK
ncbi:c-type cytochrome [Novosphingobium sp.]|uniref:c-type cytochrome n=1 Tax=Novosphingobium sp. TaxID=1874826 RepID=UPI0031CF6477